MDRKNASRGLFQTFVALVVLVTVSGCAQDPVRLTVQIVPPDGGRVTSPDWQCAAGSCDFVIDHNTEATLTPEQHVFGPAPTTFAGWGGVCRGQSKPCTIKVTRNATAIAFFRPATEQVTVGGHHTCVLRPAGTVVCWGRNSFGQVGSNSTAAKLHASTVVFSGGILRNIVQIAAGGYHTCALDSLGQVWCWGSNREGALGVGTAPQSNVAVLIRSIFSASAIAAGGHHSCAVLSDRTVRCWGSNGYGQLGDGTTNHSNTPVAVTGATEILALAAGAYHTCALRRVDANVVCWGAGNDGQIGRGMRGPQRNYPPGSPVLTGDQDGGTSGPPLTAVSIAASIGLGWEGTSVMGGYHSCAVGMDQRTYCWGNDNSDQVLGHLRPAQLGGNVQTFAAERIRWRDEPNPLPASLKVAAGAYHTCTLKVDGLDCWGDDRSGQIGGQTLHSPTRIRNAFDLAAGGYHSCAVVGPNVPGTVSCWGWNADGQVNGAPGPNVMMPTTVTLP